MAVSATVVAGMFVGAGVGAASPSTTQPAAQSPVASDNKWEDTAELQEFKTSDNKGAFYTLNEEEAEAAERVHGFRPTGEAAGIRLFTKQVPGSIPMHRLRQVGVSYHTYIVSSFQPEIIALTAPTAPRRFVDEGVLGYVLVTPNADTMALYRYSKGTVWRVARDNRKDLLDAGYKKSSGTLGFVPKG